MTCVCDPRHIEVGGIDPECAAHKRHRSVYMVEAGYGYRETTPAEALALLNDGVIRLEGADGDEESNTVTYWYARRVEE